MLIQIVSFSTCQNCLDTRRNFSQSFPTSLIAITNFEISLSKIILKPIKMVIWVFTLSCTHINAFPQSKYIQLEHPSYMHCRNKEYNDHIGRSAIAQIIQNVQTMIINYTKFIHFKSYQQSDGNMIKIQPHKDTINFEV